MEYKAGQKFKAKVPYFRTPMMVHVDHVIQSYYNKEYLIIYRVYSYHKKSWKELMCYDSDMDYYINYN